jgi:hypothetical protein
MGGAIRSIRRSLLTGFRARICSIAILSFSVFATQPVRAGDALLGWLLYASNEHSAGPVPASLAKYHRLLPKALGFSNLRVLAEGRTTTNAQGQRFLIFTADLKIMLINLVRQPNNDYLVGLQLFQADQPLLETQIKVSRGSPLFIRGPEWRDGQLILAVMVTS